MATTWKMLCASLLGFAFCSGALCDDELPGDENSQTVSAVLAAMAKALNARDPKAFAELFTPTGEFIDADDNVFDSHEAIAEEFAALFEINPKKNSVELAVEEIREIGPGILSVDCV